MFGGGKYKNKRKLGKGAYGDVYLVEDENGVQYALKLILVQKIRSEPYLKQYLRGEIQCMKTMKDARIVQLYDIFQDPNYIYLVLQYCDGGDLINYQGNLKNKVFSLKHATKVLADVILGLESLHKAGFLHRDIKSQNILIKNQNGHEVFKLADFGFSKKNDDICKTILGTNQYMSPQIFSNHPYGYEVDMWAFGVVFFFMLNLELPFKLNPHSSPSRNKENLLNLAENFSYQRTVKKTKKQLVQNCTAEMEDLFTRIFDLNPQRRISFAKIREHPVFAQHFPVVQQSSKILYSDKFKCFPIGESGQEDEFQTPVYYSRIKEVPIPYYQTQKTILRRKKDAIDFIKQNVDLFLDRTNNILRNYEILMLAFNLQKYYIILLRSFENSLKLNLLDLAHPGLKWKLFLQTKDFRQILKEVKQDLNQRQIKFTVLYDQCQDFIEEITNINDKFKQAFDCNITEEIFDGPFKKSYRKSTSYVYSALNNLVKRGSKSFQQLYLLTMVLISHAFNNILEHPQNVVRIFAEYLEQKKLKADELDYSGLREWLSKSNRQCLKRVCLQLARLFKQ